MLVWSGMVLVPRAGETSFVPVRSASYHRNLAVQMNTHWDFSKQFSEQQEAQRAARMRRLQAEAEAEKGNVKSKAGFTGGIRETEELTIKQLNYDERVVSSWESSDVPDFVPEEGSPEAEKYADLMAIKFSEGLRGSQHDGDDISAREKQRSPEMQASNSCACAHRVHVMPCATVCMCDP